MQERRAGLTDAELEALSEKIVEKLNKCKVCSFSAEDQEEIKNILVTKKWAVRATLTVAAIIVTLALKDFYIIVKTLFKMAMAKL